MKVVQRYLLFVLFVGYYASITLFYHSHIINGIRISHSHPQLFGTDEDGVPVDQSHSEDELNFIQLLSHFITSPVAGFVFIKQEMILENLYPIPVVISLFPSDQKEIPCLRGPPSTKAFA